MKDISELNPHKYPTNPSMDKNLGILFERLTDLQRSYGHDLTITSGLRSEEQQAHLISIGKTNAVHSKHLAGAAADVFDADGALAKWVSENLDRVATIGLWMEDFGHTKGWVHFQMMPPASGKRVFIP
jgi:uncharacterized protein YcbK (DUF882 family)